MPRCSSTWLVVTALAWAVYGASAAAGSVDLGPCGRLLNVQEQALARLFEFDPSQRRPVRRCDPRLAQLARVRATDMATRGYVSHVTPEGDGPNRQVVRAGYELPSFYGRGRKANNVEVITAGDDTADEAWRTWLKSRSHRRQVLALDRFFVEQDDYGVGYAENPRSKYRRYWVLITARH